MQEIRIDIILPVFYNDGSKIEDSKLLQTRKELAKRFGGCSVLRKTYGTWIDPSDDKEYKETLKARFDQKDIMITYLDINRV